MAALTLLCGVPLLPFVALVRWQRSRYKPWRSPREVRIAIIGGGWSGLQLAARLQELGVAWQGFEANDNFGGTWHPKGRYDGLALHTAAWLAAFADYPFATSSSDAFKNDQRPSGAEMQQYLERFADEHDLRRGFLFNSRIVAIDADSKVHTATLKVMRKESALKFYGPFDLVIYASIASEPYMPHMANSGAFFKAGGVQLHSSECDDATLARLVAQQRSFAVIGGSKSAGDVVLSLMKRGVNSEDRLAWIYRRPYTFFKFERFFHGGRSALGMIRGFGAFLGFCAAWAIPHLSLRLLAALDYLWVHGRATRSSSECHLEETPCCDAMRCLASTALCCSCCSCCACACCWQACCPEPDDWTTMRYGTFDTLQRKALDENVKPILGSPMKMIVSGSPKGQWLGVEVEQVCRNLSGSREINKKPAPTRNVLTRRSISVQADIIIWATGYRTGIDRIQYLLDGEPLVGEPPYDGPMLHSFVCARFPVLAISGRLFTSSGPISARTAADLACWHLCLRPRLSKKRLERLISRWQRASPNAKASENGSGEQHILFAPGFWSNIIWLQVGLIAEGIVSWQSVLRGLFCILVFNRQVPLELGLLGSLEPSIRSKMQSRSTRHKHVSPEDGALLAAGADDEEAP